MGSKHGLIKCLAVVITRPGSSIGAVSLFEGRQRKRVDRELETLKPVQDEEIVDLFHVRLIVQGETKESFERSMKSLNLSESKKEMLRKRYPQKWSQNPKQR